MRAAITDRRAAPVGVNLAPPIRYWTLRGGAFYDPADDCVVLPEVGARVTSPFIRVDQPTAASWHEEWWMPQPGRRYLNARYYDPARSILPSNGNVQDVSVGGWQGVRLVLRFADADRLSQATYSQIAYAVTADYGVPGAKVRNASLMIER